MRRYSEAVQTDVRKRMSPPHRQSVAQISQELGIHQATLYNWRKLWRLQGDIYEQARLANPKRWSRSIRCWKQPDLVWINPPADDFIAQTATLALAA